MLTVRRVFKLGDSAGMTLPKRWIDDNNVKRGDYLTVVEEDDGSLKITKNIKE